MTVEDLKYIEIQDFTPGIHEVYSTQMPPGTAHPDSYGCIASSNSGLCGLPDNDYGVNPFNIPDSGSSYYQVVGFLAIPANESDSADLVFGDGQPYNAVSKADDSDGSPYHGVLCYVAIERITGGQRYNFLDTYALVGSSGAGVTVPEGAIIEAFGASPHLQARFSHTYLSYARNVGDTNIPGARSKFQVGSPVVVAAANALYYPTLAELSVNPASAYMLMTPDPTLLPNGTAPTTLDFSPTGSVTPGAMPYGRMIIHQGRVVVAVYEYWGRYDSDPASAVAGASPTTNDSIYWTESNSALHEFQQAFSDRPYGFGVWGSLTASDLVMITHADGAILVQGDLNAPTVRRLPGVTGTAGIECDGAHTPLGFVYGIGGGGVYAWQGQDSSVNLSPQMSDAFWIAPTAVAHWNHKGTFARWGDYLLAPNGFVMDMTTQSWWKIDNDLNPVINWQASPNGSYAYGVPARWRTNGTDTHNYIIKGFNKLVKRAKWLWKSHPFVVTAHRVVNVREIALIVQADTTSQITVTLTGDDGSTRVETFNIPANPNTQLLVMTTQFEALNLSATITSISGISTVYSLRLGYNIRQRAANEPNV